MLRSFVFQIMLLQGAEIKEANDPTQEMNAGKRSAVSIRHSSMNTSPFHGVSSCLSLPQCNPAMLAYFSSSQLRERHIIIPLKQRTHMAEEGGRERDTV